MEPSEEQWQVGLDMAQRALAVKNDALHLLVDELQAVRSTSDFLASKACTIDVSGELLGPPSPLCPLPMARAYHSPGHAIHRA